MCLSKVYYNSYSDGQQDVTEKMYACRDGRRCANPEVRKYDRKFPFTKLGEAQPESQRSISERKPTPYFEPRGGSKSPSPSLGRDSRRDSGVYMGGGSSSKSSKHYDPYDPYSQAYRSSSSSRTRDDPRDYYGGRSRSNSIPQIIYMDGRDGYKESGKRSRSSSRDYSRDIPLGPVHLADEYGRRSSRSRSRDSGDLNSKYYSSSHGRGRGDPMSGYMFVDDQDERRRQRREQRRMSMDEYDPSRYIPRSSRRASTSGTVVHNDGTSLYTSSSAPTGTSSGKSGSGHVRWEDEVRAKRNRQNAEIANRPVLGLDGEPKSILKKKGDVKGKGRESDEDLYDLRRAVEGMGLPSRGRRSSSGRDLMDDYPSSRYDDGLGVRKSRGKSSGYSDDRYRYF
ncbi:hypothetical protein QBC40DRAFT_277420 [Triangularia verruculosa]|uniref:Uncharacterized protein n=1 Tax=Triangularia verruculosa TaxID=2587418 RepID=A0AAN7AWW5_9PEZI|nr:hypothetical protein QBC40DRAFT_277420 [Triangularia verruculosa]